MIGSGARGARPADGVRMPEGPPQGGRGLVEGAGPHLPIVIVGAGAAGLMAAVHASGGRRPVLMLESTQDGGRKILASGGGRCNVLPSVLDPSRFVTDSSPNTLKNLLRSWPLAEQRAFFEKELSLPLSLEEETGKLFPACNSARRVRDALVERARASGVLFRFGAAAEDLEPRAHEGGPWSIRLMGGESLSAAAVILATGGLSVPKTGSDGRGLEMARRLGLAVNPLYPALTPLTADPPVHAHLAGVSLEVTLEAPLGRGRAVTRGGFLFTHRGYSGPAVLDLSHLAVRSRLAGGAPQPIFVRWTDLDEPAWEAELKPGPSTLPSILRRRLVARLAETLLAEAGLGPERKASQLRREERRRLVALLARYPLPWTGDEGYAKAEVTGGGVDLGEVDPRTLECRALPGLFLCGEILDAFGPIGGYNFAWAWATGRLAGQGAKSRR